MLLYDEKYFQYSDGIISWIHKSLKFGDAFAALSYAFGITWEAMFNKFQEKFYLDPMMKNEKHKYSILNQIDFLKENKTRMPNHVLEIGGGRGEIAAALTYMKIPVTSVEYGSSAARLYQKTGKHYFGEEFVNTPPIQNSIANVDIDYNQFDTILMVESLEHIPAELFDLVMANIIKNFHGYFIVVNWKYHHPIAVGQGASSDEHCRLVDDNLYDHWASQAKKTIYRDGSHLVLEF
jgi:hypothetical protein